MNKGFNICLMFFVVLLTAVNHTCAQEFGSSAFKKSFAQAYEFVESDAFMKAEPILESLYKSDTLNANVNHLLGVCYLRGSKQYAKAIQRLQTASRDVAAPDTYNEGSWKERKAPGITYFYLGRTYHAVNRFKEAITNYYNYRSFISLDDVETYNQVRQQIQYAENAVELIKSPVDVKVTNLGATINSRYPDYCPVVSADGSILIFTSRREGGTGAKMDESGNYYDDIYVCEKQPNGSWSKPKSIGENINSPGHEGAIGLSPDGQRLFIYKDDNNDGNIYQSVRTGTGWSNPELLGSDINTASWETHATVTAEEDLFVFVSNRSDGGHGGRDLWYCKKLPNGEWGLAQNMGSVINTDFEEDSPFISSDGKTLIFSSQGHTSMGGFDIFKSEFIDGVWTNPQNIGYPISSAEDDVFLSLAPDGRTGYYSSSMDGGYGSADLYKLFLRSVKQTALAVARGTMKVPAMDYADIQARIEVLDEGGAIIGTYRPNVSTGYYVLVLPTGENYKVNYKVDGYPDLVRALPVSDDESYQEYDGVLELDDVVFGEDILALQDQTKALEKEKEEAAAKAKEETRLAEEAAAAADEAAKSKSDSLALAAEKEEERRKAEELVAQEKQQAELALQAEKEKAKQVELLRKKQAAQKQYELELAVKAAEEELAAQQKREEEAEEQARVKAEQEAVAKAAEEAKLKVEEELLAKEKSEKEAVEQARVKAEQEALAKAAEEAKLKTEEELLVKEKAEKDAVEQARIKAEQEALAKAEEEAKLKTEEELLAKEKSEKEAIEQARAKAEQEALAKAEEEAKLKAEEELLAKEKAEKEAVEQARVKAEQESLAKAAEEVKSQTEDELVFKKEERDAKLDQKRGELQRRIEELKRLRSEQEKESSESKEITEQKFESVKQEAAIDAKAIDAKRQAMLAKIEELKKRKSKVQEQQIVDEQAVEEAVAKEKEAVAVKEKLHEKAEQTKVEITELEEELELVERKVVEAETKITEVKAEVKEAEEKLSEDIAEEKRIAEEEEKKKQQALAAEKELQELKELEKKRIEEERLAAEQTEREQREEADRTKRELIQLEALADQQAQVLAALEIEERKKKEIEQAEKESYTKEEILGNANTIAQLKELNAELIKENLDLKKQLVVLNAKLDLILQRLDYQPEIDRVEMPANKTLANLQKGRRLILRNIFFDYNQATLRSKSKYELNKLFNFMKSNQDVRIEVSGHTDSRGNDDYNTRLSKDRAQSVVDYLVRNGIEASRLTSVGYGETRPIARNENPDGSDNKVGRQLNRRIEISLPQGPVDGVEIEKVDVPSGAEIK